ncbi:MAG: hypothetical protein N3D77_15710 [Geminicoccaceae bacterium]|nr:hypothetical protein [Geminicoccaceae bacterium]
MSGRRLDLARIEAALRELQRRFAEINAGLAAPREPPDEEVVRNLVAGYAVVDRIAAAEVELFTYGGSQHLLELNTLVLCGEDPRQRAEFEPHRKATEAWFYDAAGGNIGGLVDWYQRHANEPPFERAAGVYVRMLSEPQLFIEGNHRTGALVMSQILLRAGLPPFVVSLANAKGYFDPSTVIRGKRKNGYALLFELPRIKKRFARFLRAQSDTRFLLEPATDAVA